MNEPDVELSEAKLASWLADFDDATANGHDSTLPSVFSADAEIRDRVQRAVACVQLLRRVWSGSDCSQAATVTDALNDDRNSKGEKTFADSAATELLPGRLPIIAGFKVLDLIGRGGMGLVYRAYQESLQREVALKVLPPALADNGSLLQRFRNEATVAARLTDSHILPLLDIRNADDVPVLVMPYIDGRDLGRIVRERKAQRNRNRSGNPRADSAKDDRAQLEEMLSLLDKVIEGVAVVHGHDVLHRDIKPSNVLVDRRGNVWVSDFGLARLGRKTTVTAAGTGLGTPGYMSPEQWDGASDLDSRADVFSVGATLYHCLTLELPYQRRRVTPDEPLPIAPSKRQPLLNRDFDAVILKALEPQREHRYASATQLRDDWRRVRLGQSPQAMMLGPVRRLSRRLKRQPLVILLGILSVAVILLSALVYRGRPEPAPDPGVYHKVEISTQPPGARIVLVPVDENGDLQPGQAVRPARDQTTPLSLPRVRPGRYLVVAEVKGHGFHEVYRTVASPQQQGSLYAHGRCTILNDGTVQLPVIAIPDHRAVQNMVRFAGGDFIMGPDCDLDSTSSFAHPRSVAPFYLDSTEVTVAAYPQGGLSLPAPYRNAFGLDRHAVAHVNFYQALAHAEIVGKRLPTEAEYEFAATAAGKQRYPWGDNEKLIDKWTAGPVGDPAFDRTATDPPVFGLYSNVAEWTDSMKFPYDPTKHPSVADYPPERLAYWRDLRIIRGAPPWAFGGRKQTESEKKLGPPWLTARWRHYTGREFSDEGIGFRCARSVKPRFLTVD